MPRESRRGGHRPDPAIQPPWLVASYTPGAPVPTIRAASASVNSVAVGSAGDELQIAVAAAKLTTATAMMVRITPPASARPRAQAAVSESRRGRQSRLRLAAFLGGVHAHLVLADDETVEPTFAIYLTGRGIAPSCAVCSALNVDMLSSFMPCRLEVARRGQQLDRALRQRRADF
jgi:hypothetical protein